ncbi:RluA family pseudouridine synthase [Pendulispora albinea]|uniref:Pseudouridine synthase n=1 Tax=Pendulispora albinea TaxID=2741071 RepID=A0ABZ2LPU9_9BACT
MQAAQGAQAAQGVQAAQGAQGAQAAQGARASRAAPVTWVAPREASGVRLDQFLVRALADHPSAPASPSRAELQRWIEAGLVTVDGAPGRASTKLRAGATVVVQPALPEATAAQPDAGVVFEVLHQDDDLVVVDKPAGLVVHPARGHESGTLVNGLLARGLVERIEPENEAEDTFVRPGIVHRIDKGTSGILVVARHPRAREALKLQFQAHTILREYEAIALGDVPSRTFATLHGRHPVDRMRYTGKVQHGKHAVTHVRALERLAGGRATHVVCSLETGRTHQIRVHLSESGHAILGDPLYGRAPREPELRTIAESLGHQALHARVLGFLHPTTGAPMRFESPPPADFRGALEALRSLAP